MEIDLNNNYKIKALIIIVTMALPLIVYAKSHDNTIISQSNFLALADIHFNPFYGCNSTNNCQLACELVEHDISNWDHILGKFDNQHYPRYGEETNYLLLISMLSEMQTKAEQEQPNFVLVLGDFIAHRFSGKTGLYQRYTKNCEVKLHYKIFIAKLMRYLSMKLEIAFTDIPIYPVLGNNDSASGNYSVAPGGYFLRQLAPTWLPIIQPKDPPTFLQTFVDHGGYYSVPLDDNLKLIVLNSVLFSVNATTPRPWYLWFSNTERNTYAEQQMTWLATQLAQADERQQQVLIAYHIPVGIDIYQSLGFWSKWFGVKLQWRKDMMGQFVDIIQQYQTVIVAQLGGHLHTDGFYLINDYRNEPMSYISTTPSVSPIYLNNPGFKIYSYRTEPAQIIDFSTYYLDISQSEPELQTEYVYSQAYGNQFTPITAQSVASLFHSAGFEQGTSSYAKNYRQFFYVSATNPVIDDYWKNYWCGMLDISSVDNYHGCIQG